MIGSSRKRLALWVVIAAAAALAVVAGGLSTPSQIQSKQAEAEAVLDQIRQIDSELDKAVDAYNAASERLGSIQSAIQLNRRHLAIARRANQVAERNLEQRLVALYLSGSGDSTLEVILGATSLDDLLDRIDAAKRVSKQDSRIVQQVRVSRREIRRREAALEKALREQKRLVSDRAARKGEIESRLAERQVLYDSIKAQVAKLEAEERARQERLAREAEQRLIAAAQTSAESSAVAAAPDPAGIGLAPPSQYSGVAGVALQYLGIPYSWGGADPSGFDCSGFVMYVYGQVGVALPHNAAAQYGYGVPVSQDQLQPGDIVFFDGLGHDGIYIGGGQFVHSPHAGDVVKISSIYDSWYAGTYVGARRIL